MTEEVYIRGAVEDDAAALVDLFETLDREAPYMLFAPGERVLTEQQQRQTVREIRESQQRTLIVATRDAIMVGFAGATRLSPQRRRHIAQVVVGVRARFHRRGIASDLLQAVERWSSTVGIIRLELTVVVSNLPAVSLYKKMGYVIEGTRHAALNVDGELAPEYYMARLVKE